MDESKLWHVFSPGPIVECLGSYLTIKDVIALSRTCSELAGIYQELLPRQWNIDGPILKRFVHVPRKFRMQLGMARAVLAGHLAEEFFERNLRPSTWMDIVVDGNEPHESCVELWPAHGQPDQRISILGQPRALALLNYLESEGYTLLDHTTAEPIEQQPLPLNRTVKVSSDSRIL